MDSVIAIEVRGKILAEAVFEWSSDSETNRENGMRALEKLVNETDGVSWGDEFTLKFMTRDE